jgi:hypothetical protein
LTWWTSLSRVSASVNDLCSRSSVSWCSWTILPQGQNGRAGFDLGHYEVGEILTGLIPTIKRERFIAIATVYISPAQANWNVACAMSYSPRQKISEAYRFVLGER